MKPSRLRPRTTRTRPRRTAISTFFKHPAVLLLLGFLSTGVLGASLASFWKSREWHNEQRYLFGQRALQKKYELTEEAFKAVAETTTAAENVLALYAFNGSDEDFKTQRAAWDKSSQTWRIESKVLREKLETYFHNAGLVPKFDEIIKDRRYLGNIITQLLRKEIPKDKVQGESDQALKLVGRISQELIECGALISPELATTE